MNLNTINTPNSVINKDIDVEKFRKTQDIFRNNLTDFEKIFVFKVYKGEDLSELSPEEIEFTLDCLRMKNLGFIVDKYEENYKKPKQ